jgi:phosphoserine phosphatase
MTALHVFDLDGTLLPGPTASLLIAAAHGSGQELRALEARFAAGELDTAGFAAAVHGLWATLTPEIVAAAVAGGPWLTGDHHLADRAAASYRGGSLQEAYARGRARLSGHRIRLRE